MGDRYHRCYGFRCRRSDNSRRKPQPGAYRKRLLEQQEELKRAVDEEISNRREAEHARLIAQRDAILRLQMEQAATARVTQADVEVMRRN